MAARRASSSAGRPASILALLRSEWLVLWITVLYFAVIWLLVPPFGSARNLADIAANLSPLLLVAIGQTFVLISGGIDLSAISVISLASVAGAAILSGESGLRGTTGLFAESAFAIPVALAAMALVGAAVGVANGLAIARLRMPPLMVTLSTMLLVQGIAEWTTQAESIGDLPESFIYLGYGELLFAPASLWIVLAFALGAHLLLARTAFGRSIRAIGYNRRAAVASGVPADRTLLITYALSGTSAGLAAVLYTARLETGSPVLGEKLLLDIVGAVVLGGTSLFGGRGRISWTCFGVLFMTVLGSSLVMLRLSFAQVTMLKGALILAAALLDAWRQRARRR